MRSNSISIEALASHFTLPTNSNDQSQCELLSTGINQSCFTILEETPTLLVGCISSLLLYGLGLFINRQQIIMIFRISSSCIPGLKQFINYKCHTVCSIFLNIFGKTS